jgi:hypothetical protein
VPESDRDPLIDPLIEHVAGVLRSPVEPSLDKSAEFTARIMDAVRTDARIRRRRRWVVTGVSAAAAAVVIVAAGITAPGRSRDVTATAVQFVLPAGAAHDVAVVGDFNDWDVRATPLRRAGNEWRTTVHLAPGAHVYAFVVDGSRWVPDPAAPRAPASDFGAPNSLVTVGPGAM